MAFTLGFHIILVPFGVAFTFMMLICQYRGLRRGDQQALLLAQRWSKVPPFCSRSGPFRERC